MVCLHIGNSIEAACVGGSAGHDVHRIVSGVAHGLVRQIAPARTYTWNFDNSKAMAFIPGANIEVDVDLPPFIEHNPSAVEWLDRRFLVSWPSTDLPVGTRSMGPIL